MKTSADSALPAGIKGVQKPGGEPWGDWAGVSSRRRSILHLTRGLSQFPPPGPFRVCWEGWSFQEGTEYLTPALEVKVFSLILKN